jgi:hypothetical protein
LEQWFCSTNHKNDIDTIVLLRDVFLVVLAQWKLLNIVLTDLII